MRWRLLAWALAAALLLHGLLLDRVHEAIVSLDTTAPPIERLEAVFTRVLTPTEPVQAVAPPPPRPRPRRSPRPDAKALAAAAASAAQAAAQAASAASAASQAAALADAASAPAPDPLAASASAPSAAPDTVAASEAQVAAASAPSAAPAASAALPSFSWPVSTRLSYQLNGWYNGEVLGQAQVDWLRQGERYQVHLEVSVGPGFAPLVRRRMSSEGVVTPSGLVPRRYEQETTQIIGGSRRAGMRFDADAIVLANGQRVPTHADVQDTASQFIQIIYLLTTQQALQQPGQAIEFGLALPRRVDRWVYEVTERAVVNTPFGAIPTLHVKPRRRAEPGNLTAEMWYAPSLQMLPVRIRIEQDQDVWIDLRLERPPQQAGP